MTTGKKVLLVLGLVYGLPVAGLAALLIVISIDEPPPPDDDLRVVRLQIPDDQNAFTYFQQAIDKLDLPKDDEPAMDSPAPPPKVKPLPGEEPDPDAPPPTRKQRWDALTNGDVEWDQPIVDEVLKRNEAALALFEKGLAVPQCQAPQARTFDEYMHVKIYGHLDIANTISVRARDAMRRGDPEAAFADAVKLLHFGQKIEAAKGNVVSYLVGLTIKDTGCGLVLNELQGAMLPSERLRRLAAEFRQSGHEGEALADAFRVEYEQQSLVIRDFEAGVLAKYGQGTSRQPIGGSRKHLGPVWRFAQRVQLNLIFKPNRTRRMFADIAHAVVKRAPKHFSEARQSISLKQQPTLLERLLRPNWAGHALYRIMAPAANGACELKCAQDVSLSAASALLAMKAYKLDKGELPETLEQLVPEYLDAVPIDDFDGKPLRYNAAKKIIYSVGEDLEDNGGTTKQEFIDARIRELGFDPKDADPDQLRDFEAGYPWEAADPAFAIEF